jgi:hypothetical protein
MPSCSPSMPAVTAWIGASLSQSMLVVCVPLYVRLLTGTNSDLRRWRTANLPQTEMAFEALVQHLWSTLSVIHHVTSCMFTLRMLMPCAPNDPGHFCVLVRQHVALSC